MPSVNGFCLAFDAGPWYTSVINMLCMGGAAPGNNGIKERFPL